MAVRNRRSRSAQNPFKISSRMFVDDVKPLDTSPSRAAGLVADIYRLRWPKIRFAHELKKATKELPADSVQKFCDEVCYNLMLTGTQLNCPERHLLDLIVHMVESETISWITVVNTFAKFNDFEKPKCVAAICDVLRDCLLEISCDPRNDCECKQLSEAIERILEWFLHGAEESPKKSINSLRPIAECFQLYSENRFIHVVIHLRSQLDVELIHRWHSELNNFWVGLKGPFYDPDMVNECYKSILESINRLGEKPSIDLHSVTINYLRDARPTISTLLTVYSSFRMLKGISEICDACLMLGDLLGLTGPDLLNDITRTALLIAVQPDEFQERNGPVHVFVFQTVPLLMVELINRGRVTREEIIATLDYICDQRTLLDAVDAKSKYNFFQCFTDQICEQRVLGITIQDVQYILDRRLALIKREIIERRHENNPASTYQVFLAAKKAQKNLVKQDYTASIWMRSMPILIRSQFTFDSICAWCALDGNLDSLISKLLSLNTMWQVGQEVNVNCQDGPNVFDVFDMWDISFLLLTRLRMVYIDLQIEKLAVLNTTVAESNSVFYRWNVYVSQHLDERKPIKVDESLKLNFAQKFADLKHGQCYWDQTWNFNDLIDTIPIVGEMILDEIHSKVITMPPVPNIEPLMHPISQILLSYTKFTSMILCIVEWLSTQKCDPDRQIFVKCIIALFTTEHAVKADFPQWLELMLITRPILHELLEEANPPEMPYPWIVQCARRALPSIRRTAAPDMQQLKDAYLYACRQNWASPNVISLVDKCDRNESIWCKVWFCQMRKSVTLDELTANSEICMAAAFCAPIPFFIHFAQNIVDHVLQQDNYNSAVGTPLSIVLGQMLMRLLILSIWANKQRYLAVLKKLGKTPPMRQQFQPGELFIGDNVPPKLDDFADDKVSEEVKFGPNGTIMKTISFIMARFFKETMTGHLKPTTSFIIRYVIELAIAPDSEYRRDLVERIPMPLIFSLGRIDPHAMTIDVFLTLYPDLTDVAMNLNCLKFACVHRKMRVV